MARFRIEIEAEGESRCQPEIGDGEIVPDCRGDHCVGCITRRFVALLATRLDVRVIAATLDHGEGVVDDMAAGVRHGVITAKAEA